MIEPTKIYVKDFSLDGPYLEHTETPTLIVVKNFVFDGIIAEVTEDTVIIMVKTYPTNEFSAYNYKDTMEPSTIYIQDYPEYMSEYYWSKVGFRAHLYAKTKIGVTPEHPGKAAVLTSHSHLDSHMKLRGRGTEKFAYSPVASPIIKQRITGTEKFAYKLFSSSLIGLKGAGKFKIKHNARMVPGNYYQVQRYSLGYWDDYALEDMDDLTNEQTEGIIIN